MEPAEANRCVRFHRIHRILLTFTDVHLFGLTERILVYLYDEGRIEENLAVFVPRSSYKGNPEIPSVYSTDEIGLLLDSLNRASR
jgi:hypothetical protein